MGALQCGYWPLAEMGVQILVVPKTVGWHLGAGSGCNGMPTPRGPVWGGHPLQTQAYALRCPKMLVKNCGALVHVSGTQHSLRFSEPEACGAPTSGT